MYQIFIFCLVPLKVKCSTFCQSCFSFILCDFVLLASCDLFFYNIKVIEVCINLSGHYGGALGLMGGETSSSGGELEAGELVIDDSYTQLTKKKKKSKKSKKKKEKERDREKDKSGREKKHNRVGSKKGLSGEMLSVVDRHDSFYLLRCY